MVVARELLIHCGGNAIANLVDRDRVEHLGEEAAHDEAASGVGAMPRDIR